MLTWKIESDTCSAVQDNVKCWIVTNDSGTSSASVRVEKEKMRYEIETVRNGPNSRDDAMRFCAAVERYVAGYPVTVTVLECNPKFVEGEPNRVVMDGPYGVVRVWFDNEPTPKRVHKMTELTKTLYYLTNK